MMKVQSKDSKPDAGKPVTLKTLAEYLDLSPATISIVLNNSPVAKSISLATRERVLDAAKNSSTVPTCTHACSALALPIP
ncbi:hypothetical protein [Tunturiibacter gelidiferens]|uniref:hypothetical protein n=1 Tax=Tunturiibacter gelidiferens TaxID=3069689 RepID=UPI003D9BD1EC